MVGDQALDCRCCGEGHVLALVGSMRVNLSVGFLCRLAHEPRWSAAAQVLLCLLICIRFGALTKSQR